jgi:multiple sugar transport system substrate-binding protein/raffinose/stachyose/melibiose transport system substrate-binding protein
MHHIGRRTAGSAGRAGKRGRTALRALGLSLAFLLIATMSWADGEVTITHYFGGDLGRAGLEEIFGSFKEATGTTVVDSPIGHEDFKTGILVRAAGGKLPDVFSYWAGARTQFVVDAGNLGTIDDMWAAQGLDAVVAKSVADGATMYNGSRYLVPFGYHYAGMFYNAKVMADAGVMEFPTDWDGFLALCENLKSQGIIPIALGSMARWPAQFWFDYLLLRTAGPEYRARLMAGEASYTDAEVQRAMQLWKDLVDAGYFAANANADDWTQASDRVTRGDAAMTLMGTWITGYWNGNGLMAGDDYDFFEFPMIDAGVPNAVVGPVDGWLISANSENRANAEALVAFLASDPASQARWAQVQGALSPNVNVDESTYTSVMVRALEAVGNADTFAFNYDLATTPPAAEYGLDMFARFMDNPANYSQHLADTEAGVRTVFDS